MRNITELYLNGQLVDLGQDGGIYFNYKQKDVSNPTVVKNSFSKTLTIPGTDNNNNIFNNIWNLTRVQTTDLTTYFNQSKRVGFELFINGELIEQGYCKLNSIKRDGNIEYNISLYGGLGDFFYNLSYNSDSGEKRTLADLDFGEDLTFTINKETIKDAWDKLKAGSASTISFAPAYNGVPDVLDADKVLVNTHNYTGTIRSYMNNTWVEHIGFPDESGEYGLTDGYGLAELENPITEWKMRDIRSYLQRPVLSIPKLLDAIGNPANNGGYTLELDPDFFNDDNPYYKNAWMTLPMITELNINRETTPSPITVTIDSISPNESGVTTMDLTLSGSTSNTNNINLRLKVNCDSTSSNLYTSATHTDAMGGFALGGIGVQIVGIDNNGNEVAGSNVCWLASTYAAQGSYYHYPFNGAVLDRGENPFKNYSKVETYISQFDKVGNSYEWHNNLDFKMSTNVSIARYQMKLVYMQRSLAQTKYRLFSEKDMHGHGERGYYFTYGSPTINNAYSETSTDVNSYTNAVITQNDLLNTDFTPSEYLLSYCKLFNLYFEKDLFEKKIRVLTSKNFYNGEVDLTYDIDRNVEINPLSFEHKWYSFNYKSGDGGALSNYKAKYGVDFGQQRVNTGYEFDSETEELLKGNVFTNAAQVLEASRYYQIISTTSTQEGPAFLTENATFKLFNAAYETTDIPIATSRMGFAAKINKKSTTSVMYDGFDKVQLHSEDKPIDGKNVLLFYNGETKVKSSSFVQPYYWITDDIDIMQQLNENPCWLYTTDEYDDVNNKIAIKINEFPYFSRYIEDEQFIYSSWDFGRTRELFIPEINFIDGEATIYERYWKAYINDLYDVDTRIVIAYIKFDENPTRELLKHFYFFENSYWVIDEIIDYNPTSYGLTKVRFVKVNDKDNYLNDNLIPPEPIPPTAEMTGITLDNLTWVTDIPYTGGTATKDNCTYAVTAHYDNGDTLNVTSAATVTGSQIIDASAIPNRHIAGLLVLTASYSGFTDVEDVSIYQAAAPETVSITSTSPIPATSTTITFTVTATKPARVKISSSALPQDLTQDVGSGTTTGSFTIPANTHNYVEYFGLTAWIIDDTAISDYTSVEQLGAEGPTLTGITLDNVAWVTDVPASGGTATYQNCSYIVTAHYSDNTTQDVTNQAIMSGSTTLNVSSTTATTREEVGVINVIAFYYDGHNPFSATAVVRAYQAAYVPVPTQTYVTYNAAGQLDQAEVGVSITINSYSGGTDTDSFTMNGSMESEDGDIDVNLNPTAGTTPIQIIVTITGFTGYTDGQLTIRVAYTDYDSDYVQAGTGSVISTETNYVSAAILYVDLIFTPSNQQNRSAVVEEEQVEVELEPDVMESGQTTDIE